jgi:GxxExxY protein
MALLHEEITHEIIGAAFEVYRVLGYGFLEKVYQRAMQVQLRAYPKNPMWRKMTKPNAI